MKKGERLLVFTEQLLHDVDARFVGRKISGCLMMSGMVGNKNGHFAFHSYISEFCLIAKVAVNRQTVSNHITAVPFNHFVLQVRFVKRENLDFFPSGVKPDPPLLYPMVKDVISTGKIWTSFHLELSQTQYCIPWSKMLSQSGKSGLLSIWS